MWILRAVRMTLYSVIAAIVGSLAWLWWTVWIPASRASDSGFFALFLQSLACRRVYAATILALPVVVALVWLYREHYETLALSVVRRMTDQAALVSLARTEKSSFVRQAALNRIKDPKVVNKISDELMLAELRERDPRGPDSAFERHHHSLRETLMDVRELIMPYIPKQEEASIKRENSLYAYYAETPTWHAFEGPRDEAYAHLSTHFWERHSKSSDSYTLQSDGQGKVSLIANTPSLGLQHFIWRTTDDTYILMLSS